MEIALSEKFTYKKLIKFTLPTIVMMIFTSIYGVVDGVFVSNFVGSSAFASVNLIMPVTMILGTIGFMMGTGGSALVSKTIGEGDNDKANRYFSMLVYLLVIIGTIFTIAGVIFIEPVAKLLKADEEMLPDCITYGRTLLIFLVPFCLHNAFSSFMIVAEKPTFGLVISIISGVTNMFLDFLFMYVFKMGVFGAALATGISQVVGVIVPLVYFISGKNKILKFTKTKIELSPMLQACVNGSSEMVTNLSMSLINILFNAKLMELVGANGVSAYGVIMYVGFLFVGTYVGYSVGSAPVISYHYGAGNKEELKSLLSKSLKLLGITALVMTALSEILARPLASIFASYDKELLELTVNAIRLYSLSYIISWFNIFASSFFTALNDGLVSALISFLRTLVFQVITILVLPNIWGIDGIWLSVLVSEIFSIIVSLICYAVNKKKYGYV